jgi:citrate lyase subunit beta / citryl-CoA lyase
VPRRCALIVPGGRAKMVEKAATLPADVVMLDLDDAVVFTDAEKAKARALVADALQQGTFAAKCAVVRINAPETAWWRADIGALRGCPVDAVCLPKINSAEDVETVASFMDTGGGFGDQVGLWPMIETPGAVLYATEIAGALPRVAALAFGVGDYTAATFSRFTDGLERLAYPLAKVVCAARYRELLCFAPAFPGDDHTRVDVVRAQAEVLRTMGFDGALCMHPSHVEIINEAFTPTVEEVRWASGVVAAFRSAAARGEGAVVSNGHLIERVHVTLAERTLMLARAAGV